MKRLSARLGVALLCCAVSAVTLLGAAATDRLSQSDRRFVDAALELNTAAMNRAQVVSSSADNYVLDYAEEILSDRQAATAQLIVIAQSAHYRSSSPSSPAVNVSPSRRPGASNQESNEAELQSGYAPVPYFTEEVKNNKEAFELYQREIASAQSSALRAYARNFLPKMKGELDRSTHLLRVEQSLHPTH